MELGYLLKCFEIMIHKLIEVFQGLSVIEKKEARTLVIVLLDRIDEIFKTESGREVMNENKSFSNKISAKSKGTQQKQSVKAQNPKNLTSPSKNKTSETKALNVIRDAEEFLNNNDPIKDGKSLLNSPISIPSTPGDVNESAAIGKSESEANNSISAKNANKETDQQTKVETVHNAVRNGGDLSCKNYQYLCHVCDLRLPSVENLTSHLQSLHNISEMFCKECNENLTTEIFFKHSCYKGISSKSFQSKDSFNCKSCDKVFTDRRELVRHVKAAHRQARNTCLDCKQCGMKFTKYSMLLNHRKFLHSKCGTNGKSNTPLASKDEGKVDEHLIEVKPINSNDAKENDNLENKQFVDPKKCNFCNQHFSSMKLLKKHLLKIHEVRVTEQKKHKCNICSKMFLRPSLLKTHLQMHSNIKNFKCHHCDKSFFLEKSLKLHLDNVKKSSKDGNYLCELCGKCFNHRYTLNRHIIMKHSDEKPFQCQYCEYKCNIKDNLKRHMMLHLPSKELKCALCDGVFNSKTNLRNHMKYKHSDDKKFKCDKCGKFFKANSDLKRHMLIHEDAKQFNCTCCSKAFNRLFHLKRHMTLIHKIEYRTQRVHPLQSENSTDSTDKNIDGNDLASNETAIEINSASRTTQESANVTNTTNENLLGAMIEEPAPKIVQEDEIPKVFEQKFTEISQSAPSPLTNLTPVQNAGSSMSILSALQQYDRTDEMLDGICFGKQSCDLVSNDDGLQQQTEDFLPTNFTQSTEISLADCITMDLQSSANTDLTNIPQNNIPYPNPNLQDDTNFTVLMNNGAPTNSSAFFDHYFPSLNIPDGSYDSGFPTPAHCDLSSIPSLPMIQNSLNYENIGDNFPVNQTAQRVAQNHDFIPQYDSLCNLQTGQHVIPNSQPALYPQSNGFQPCYGNIESSVLGPNANQLIDESQQVIPNINCNPGYSSLLSYPNN